MQAPADKVPPDHPIIFSNKYNLAVHYGRMRKWDQSIPLFEDTLRFHGKVYGTDHCYTIRIALVLGGIYRDAGQIDKAVAVFDEWVPRARMAKGSENRLGNSFLQGASTYELAGQHAKAEMIYQYQVALSKQKTSTDLPEFALKLSRLGANLLKQRKYTDSDVVLRECLTIGEKHQPDSWTTLNTKSMLGEALLAEKKYAGAEPLLVQGFEGMKQRVATIPKESKNRLADAFTRIVRLYDNWDKN